MASVLYYDPDPVWRETVRRDLAADGSVEVLTAATFREAVSLVRSGAVDAAAADPPENEVLPFVSTIGQLRGQVPVILFMPRGRAPTALDGMNGGADRFVEKREPAADQVPALANAVRAAIGRRRSERRLEERADHLEFLTRTALDFIGMEDGDDPYDYIARKVVEIVPGSMVAAQSLNEETGVMTVRAIAGPPADLAALDEELGRPMVGFEMAVAAIPVARAVIGCQTLTEGPTSAAQLFLNHISDEVGERLDERLSWGRAYIMGFSCRQGVLGNITIRLRRGADIENRELVEAFVGQASVALLRRVARQRLLESEARYRAVVESQHELICRFAPDGTHRFANEAYCRFFGLDPATVVGSRFTPAVPVGERDLIEAYFRSFSPDRPDGTLEYRVVDAAGSVRWLQWNDRAFFRPDGAVAGFQSVGRDVTERKQAEEALAALTAELEERVDTATAELRTAIRDIEAFSHHVSHDLRAPLRAIDGYLGILMARFGPELEPDAVAYVGRAREGVHRASLFLDGLLSLSRLSHLPLNLARIETDEIVRSMLDELLPGPGSEPVEVVVGPLPPCRADPEMLRHVFQNLLSNAVKFTKGRDPPRIEIEAREEGLETIYAVRDNGVGFPPEYAAQVFDEFTRFHDAREYEGSGIGLPLVRRIVERHGGRCWAETAPGEGSTFFFTLPAA
jgi:PAS domain S-box-containing protein